MPKNSFLIVLISAMSVVLVAGRCDHDEASAPAATTVAPEPVEVPPETAAPVVTGDTLEDPTEVADPGVENDPIGDPMGGEVEDPATFEDPGASFEDDSAILDDTTFEPEAVPDDGGKM